MSNATYSFFGPLPGLPDPDRDPQFYAGVPSRRLAAWVIDFVIVAAISIIAIPIFGILTLGLGFFAAPAVFAVLSFIYRTAMLTSRSATWGMRIMGIELRRGDGERFDFGLALAHVGFYTLSVFLTVPLVITVVTVLSTRYQQTLHDILLRTTAINTPED
jgi:uncharacterized RDD family membrane protein YckC